MNPLFAENPLVTGNPDIRFYAGGPLVTRDNFRLGTLCVSDTKPRDGMSEDHKAVLVLLARMVVNALDSRRLTMRAHHQSRMMTRLAEAAVSICQALTVSEIAHTATETACALVVADAAYLNIMWPAPGEPSEFVATRGGAKDQSSLSVPWQTYGKSLVARKSLTPAIVKDLPSTVTAAEPMKGSWIGFLIGLDKEKPLGHLQLWRQYTTSFTDLETAMLTDVARVASPAAERLIAR